MSDNKKQFTLIPIAFIMQTVLKFADGNVLSLSAQSDEGRVNNFLFAYVCMHSTKRRPNGVVTPPPRLSLEF